MVGLVKKLLKGSSRNNNNHFPLVEVLIGNTYKRAIIIRARSFNFFDVLLEDGRLFLAVSRERIKIIR